MNPGKTQTVTELAARALGPYEARPSAEDVALLVGDLITSGQQLHEQVSRIPVDQRTERTTAALDEWAYFADAGPRANDDHATWNYARGLARIIRTLTTALGS